MKTLVGLTAACAIAVAQATFVRLQPATAPTGNGVIDGTAVNQITREPMKKVTVTLMGTVSLTALTDASGHFAFKDLATGQYTLQAQSVAYGDQRQNASRIVDLAADQHISDLTLTVAPAATISGRVVDENGAPMQHCGISAIVLQNQNGRRTPEHRTSTQSDALGNYQLDRIASGKYYVMASCQIRLPLPHPLMDRGSPDIPMERYGPRLYPASTTFGSARRITVPAGANVSGIDFQMTPTQGVTVKGQIHAGMPDAVPGVVEITLRPSGEMASILPTEGSRGDSQSGTFHFTAVLPGSYELTATSFGEHPSGYAQISLNIGSTAPDPIDLTLAPLPTVNGSLRWNGDAKASLSNRDIYMNPLDGQVLRGPTNAQTKEDGTFHIAGLPPGRWALSMNGDGYIKSMQLNDEDASPERFELRAGAPTNTIRIVLATDWAQVEGTVSASGQGAQIFGVLWPEQSEGQWSPYNRDFIVEPRGHFQISNVAPGKYLACAVENPVGMGMILQNMELREKIRSRCEAVEVDEGAHTTIQLTAISRDDLDKLLAESDDQ